MTNPWRWLVAIVITATLVAASAGYFMRQRKAAREQSAAIRQDKQVHTSPQVTRTTCIGGITYMWVQEGIYVSLTPKWEVVADKPALIPCQ